MVANNSLTIDLNTSPYWDDYDISKGYHRLIFKPAVAVQARELTQIQSIQQNQIDKMAENLFKEGSLISGGQFILDDKLRYIQVKDLDVDGLAINVENFVGTTLTGLTTGVKAIVEYVDSGSELQSNKKTLYVKYVGSGPDGTTAQFSANENLLSNTGYKATVINSTDSRGIPYIFKILEGTVFAKDHFISFPTSHIVVSRYTTNTTKNVGFIVQEEIVTFLDDATLLDPAQGSPNYAAPGADRLKISVILSSFDVDNTPEDFILLFRVENGILQEKYEKTQYNVIRDYIAGRTQDESGSYYVRGWNVSTREHLKTETNLGLYSGEEGGNNSLLAVGIAAGKGYVQGYDIETLVTNYVPVRKGLDYKNIEQQPITANYGNYILVKELIGSFPVNDTGILYFYNAAQNAVSLRKSSTTLPSGSLIGSARIKSIVPISGVMGTANAEYAIFLYDINLSSGNITNARSIYIDNGSAADCHADLISFKIFETNNNTAIYYTGTNNLRKIRDNNDEIDTTFVFTKNFPISIATNGTFSVSSPFDSEIFNFSPGILTDLQKKNFILSLNNEATVSMSGTVDVNGTTLVTGTGTNFTRLNVGDKITITGRGTYTIATITNDGVLNTTSVVSGGSGSGIGYVKQYNVGDIIDFTIKGAAAGENRTIEIAASTVANFNMKETLSSSISANLICKMNRTDAKEIRKIIKKNRFVRINAAISGTSGPYNLGISDVFKINSVRRLNGTNFTAADQGTDVTSFFTLDNGQRKSSYENAKIIKKQGLTIAANDFLLISLDYFEPDFTQGVGYFSVDSYPIDDANGYANTNGMPIEFIYKGQIENEIYDLRNCIDTRPVKSNTATDSTTVSGSSVSPAISGNYVVPIGGLRTPQQGENFIIDYSFYLPRNDLIVCDKNGRFRVIEGKSDLSPKTPDTPPDSMAIARLKIAPYPSLGSSYATQLKRLDLANQVNMLYQKRYTMQGIGLLEKRIEMLEYYTALSLLEKQAIEMKVTDENGLDRFKNGIFVDPFNDHSLGDLGNPDFNIAIDPVEKSLRPKFIKDSINYRFDTGTGVVNNNGLVTLNYAREVYSSQPFATDIRNAAGFFWNFKGALVLETDSDTWTETETIPDIMVSVGPTAQSWNSLVDAYGTVWNDWETTWSGTNTINVSDTTTRTGTNQTRTIVNDVTTTTTQTRDGNQLTAQIITQSTDIGDRVIDTSIIPYMRSRALNFTAYGLKPNTRFYPFFDDQNVSLYCAMRTVSETNLSNNAIGTTQSYSSFGVPLISDALGILRGVFWIPNNSSLKFTVGTKKLRLTDSFNNGISAISAAEANYTASGLTQTKQGTIITTTVPNFSSVSVIENRTISDTNRISTTERTQIINVPNFDPSGDPPGAGRDSNGDGRNDPPEPIAQTFYINTNGRSEVIFLSDIDLFFQTKDTNLGVTVEVREVDSAGQITNRVIPYSIKYISSSQINTSTNGTVLTRVTFNSPLILQDKTEYAFVIIPEQNNPNTRVWTAKLGQNDLITGKRVTEQPASGNLFVSSNNKTWSTIQDEDIKFVLHRCRFNIASGSFNIKNISRGMYTVQNVTGNWSLREEIIHGESRITLNGLTGVDIAVNDVINGVTSSAAGTVRKITGSGASKIYYVTYANNLKLKTSESITVTSKNTTGTINTIVTPVAKLYSYKTVDTNTNRLTVEFLPNQPAFELNEYLTGQVTGSKAQILSYFRYPYSLMDFEPAYLEFFSTSTQFRTKNANSLGQIGSFETIELKENKEFDEEKSLFSYEEELSILTNSSVQHEVSFVSGTDFASPVLDLNRTYSIIVHNIINNSEVDEDNIFGGECINKYVSQKITLNEGMDAEDLNVYLTGYKPPGSNILVYAKFIHAEDGDKFEDKNWIKLNFENESIISNIANKNDFKELKYSIPTEYMTGAEGEYQYISGGVTYTGFKYFQFKILLLGTSSVKIPRVKDLRAMCLQI